MKRGGVRAAVHDLLSSCRFAYSWPWRFRRARRHVEGENHYSGWSGYRHPISLSGPLSKEAAEALGAQGKTYLIANYDEQDRLIQVRKILAGRVFFEFEYAYQRNGRLQTAKTTNAKGETKFRSYDERGRSLPGSASDFW